MLVSLLLAVPLTAMKMSRIWIIRTPVAIYIEVIRGTPLLVQLVYIYFALPFFGIRLPPLLAGFIGLVIHLTAYLVEAYRAGITSLPKGQSEAADALGVTPFAKYIYIILPQALVSILPVLNNYFLQLFKDTSLVSAITVTDLLYQAELITARTYDYFEVYTAIFLLYLAVSYPTSVLMRRLERHEANRRAARGSVRT